MSFFFNDELNVNGKIITKDEIKTETNNTAITYNFIAQENNFYPVNISTITIFLPEITSSNNGGEISFAFLKTSGRSITIYSNTKENQKILDSFGSEQNSVFNSNSSLEIIKYKSLYFQGDSVYFSISNPGSGYTSESSIIISITGGGGIDASCSVGLQSGIITAINITNDGGSGYDSNDIISIVSSSGGSTAGFGFSGKLILNSSGAISSIVILNGGSGYVSTDVVSISSSGSGATTSISLETNLVPVITFQDNGSGYTQVPTISITHGNGGSNLEITGTLNKGIWVSY